MSGVRSGAAPAGAAEGEAAARSGAARALLLLLAALVPLLAVSIQLVRLALQGGEAGRVAVIEPFAPNAVRPDVLDRKGRLIAADVMVASLYADPRAVIDRDEVVERLAPLLPGLDQRALLAQLANKERRFVWIRRGLSPELARDIHDLGLAGLAFRKEPHRSYPRGRLAAHVLGLVNIDNRGLSGIERLIEDRLAKAPDQAREPVRLSIDLAVQHAVSDELERALQRYRAKAATAVVLDVDSGEIVAAVSLPDFDPAKPAEAGEEARLDRITGGVYELGSIFKLMTIAMALELGTASLGSTYDAREPLQIGSARIADFHGQRRILSLREVFLHSSNIGASRMALEVGSDRQLGFLARLGLIEAMRTEAGPIAAPLLPRRWGEIETATISYGHGLAVSPLQFAAAAASLVNGGRRVRPTFLKVAPGEERMPGERVVSADTSLAVRELLRLNVLSPAGTGRRAEVEPYRVGGKTGTAELPENGRYASRRVIASFLAAFPMDAPRYLTLVSLFEPEPTFETRGQITAGVNAAPVTQRVIARIGPLLGLIPAQPDAVLSLPPALEAEQRGI